MEKIFLDNYGGIAFNFEKSGDLLKNQEVYILKLFIKHQKFCKFKPVELNNLSQNRVLGLGISENCENKEIKQFSRITYTISDKQFLQQISVYLFFYLI